MGEVFYQQGITKANEKDYEGAIAAFDQALEDNPELIEAYYNRGLAHFNLGNAQGAIADYTRALQLETDHVKVYYARGLAYLVTSNLDAAIADAKQAILLQPDYAAAYSLLGTIRQRQGETEKAIASYKKAAERYLDQHDVTHCRRCLGKIRKLQSVSEPDAQPPHPPNTAVFVPDIAAFLQQAVEKAKQKDYRGAMEDLDWVLQLDPQDAQAYASRGQVSAELGDWQGAIEDYQQAANLFINQANPAMAQQMVDTIKRLKAASTRKISQKSKSYSVDRTPRSTARRTPSGRISPAVQRKLLRLGGDDRKIAVGLVERLKDKHPGMSEDWYWEKAIYDLGRDR
ncbi:MAG: tetratricopeptide repeat protein [Cyanothece sp. SIO1E1]|nr:tetratricopeptide repeat protein [Cyanothece sp. SIO1E1]